MPAGYQAFGSAAGFVGSGSGFSPIDLSPAAWFDAGDAGGVDGQNLATWPDLSGNAFDLDAQDAVNVFNADGGSDNRPYVAFTTGSTYRAAPLIVGADAARTMFVVSKRVADASMCVLDGRYGFNGFAYSYGLVTSDRREVYLAGIAGEYDTGSLATNNWEMVCCINTATGGSSGAQRFRLNGAERTLNASNGTLVSSTLYFSVGGDHPNSFTSVVDVSEVIVYAGVMSAPNIALVEAYLLDKYGL